ncbi:MULTISPECIES: NYN domain-containing protein [unclassified Clostridium]|uniref:Tetracycline resistance protein n=1 Tax=Clostridium botulinum (strain Eklund 17B / Type B) TaxID=935198 RepID=B2TIF9_CLOBB|nr:NYN domain-containing protein [Clostridium sp. RO3]ACD21820.1 tetracycline resistance protein [Clostridium botulinum B str. Eklund 17B (NRP)]MBY6977785.1 NYN domain-containing protein [Clostridium botulinum]MBY7002479.1 NYN domain-containing protein [Clostridium botulinum]MCR1275359.1 NYN domain-containing protein [Clostridium botulinum]NFD70807.1 NYN domain-containing protein [Clostridium botulinum]
MKIIFVDGYNVINSWPDLKIKKNNNFDGARRSLIDTMHNYGVYNDCKVIIVFDAHKVPGSIQKLEAVNKNLSIIFTKDGETADSYIEKEVNLLGRKYEVIVVTSDWLEQQTIFQRGAVRMSSLEFYNEVLDVENSIRKRKNKSKVSDKNILSDNIDLEMLKKLEKIRRSE